MKCLMGMFVVLALAWADLWWTPEQQAQRDLERGEYASAAQKFRDPARIGTAWFRAGEFEKAEQAFARVDTPEANYNRGNCLVMLGKYDAAVGRYDAALDVQPDWEDALVNRKIAAARAALLDTKGGDMGDQKLGADEIRFDRKKDEGGQQTEVSGEQATADATLQAIWLRRVQTQPADFLRAKFAFQLEDQ